MSQFYSHPEREGNPHALPDAEVFFNDEPSLEPLLDEQGELLPRGWYYWFCFSGCMPDGDPIGPFETKQDAIDDCREFAGECEAHEKRVADHIDGYDRDDLGESPDY